MVLTLPSTSTARVPAKRNNVSLNVQLGTEVTLQTATPSAGSCTSGAGTVDCQLGDIPGGASRNVVLSLIADSVGTANVVGDVTADQDNNSSNNQATSQVTVTPTVDMSINATSAQVTVNQATSLDITIDNLSNATATSISVTIDLDAGLRADNADWSAGTCTINNAQVTCQASSLVAQTNAAITLDVTGTTQGQQSYTATVSASEPDPSSANNSATGTVTVNAQPTANNDGESSGPIAPATVLALFGLFLWRRQSREFARQ